jgi:hypothetical protein
MKRVIRIDIGLQSMFNCCCKLFSWDESMSEENRDDRLTRFLGLLLVGILLGPVATGIGLIILQIMICGEDSCGLLSTKVWFLATCVLAVVLAACGAYSAKRP